VSPRPRLEVLEDRCLLNAGSLDPTFGSGGIVTTTIGTAAQVNAVTLQTNGDIVAAGVSADSSGNNLVTLARYLPSGQLDPSFGTGGIVTTRVGKTLAHYSPTYNGAAETVAIQADGKIVVAGDAAMPTKQDPSAAALCLVRYNSNGSLDTTFGTGGIALAQVNANESEMIHSLALQSNGDIVAAGFAGSAFLVARFTSNGSLDTTFAHGGVFSDPSLGVAAQANGVAIQPDGKILAAGHNGTTASGQEVELVRLNSDGSLDSAFGTGGKVLHQFSTSTNPVSDASGLALQSVNGQSDIITVGQVTYTSSTGSRLSGAGIERLQPNGSIDTSFGTGGLTLNPNVGSPSGVAVQTDGDLLVSGVTRGSPDWAVERLLPNGTLDSSYGTNGIAQASFFGKYDKPAALALQPDGSVVAAGLATTSTNQHVFALSRFLSSEPEIGSFTANPNPVTAGSSVTLTASNITDGNPNVSITQVAIYLDSNDDGTLEPGTDQLLGYATQTSPGVWTLTDSSAFGLTAGTYTLFAQAEDSDGVFGDPVALTLTVQ
jgi:uncharacterized delta-60 repeat protein